MDIHPALNAAIEDMIKYWVSLKTCEKKHHSPISVDLASILSEEEIKQIYQVKSNICLPSWAQNADAFVNDISHLLPKIDRICKISPVLIWAYASKYRKTNEPRYWEVPSLTPSRLKQFSGRFVPSLWCETNKAAQTAPRAITPEKMTVLNKYRDIEFFLYLLDSFSSICDPYLSAMVFDYHTDYLKLYFLLSDYKELKLGKIDTSENFCSPDFITSLKNIRRKYHENKAQHLKQFCDIMKVYLWSYHRLSPNPDPRWPHLFKNLFEINCRKLVDGYKFLSYMDKTNSKTRFCVPKEPFDEDDKELDAISLFYNSETATGEDINAFRAYIGLNPITDIDNITDNDVKDVRDYMNSHLFS